MSLRSLSLQHWVLGLALIFGLAGGIGLTAGALKPAYTDSAAAIRILAGAECEIGVPNPNPDGQCESAVWHKSMNSLRTYKWFFVDLGAGLLVTALSYVAFAIWIGGKTGRELTTPKNVSSILGLVALVWFAQLPAFAIFFIADVTQRDCCPWWADSVGIPLMGTAFGVITFSVPYLMIWAPLVIGAKLPVRIDYSVANRPGVNALWTIVAGILGLAVAAYLVAAIFGGLTLMVPFLWLSLWLVLCARAAALSRHTPRSAEA